MLPPLALKIWLAHYAYEGKTKPSWPSVQTLMEVCGIDKPHTLYKWRAWLVANGWLKQVGEITPRHKGTFSVPMFSCLFDGTVCQKMADGRKRNRMPKNGTRTSAAEWHTDQCHGMAQEVDSRIQVDSNYLSRGTPSEFLENNQKNTNQTNSAGHPPSTPVRPVISAATESSDSIRIKISDGIDQLDQLDHKRAMKLYSRYGGKYPATLESLAVIEAEIAAAQSEALESR